MRQAKFHGISVGTSRVDDAVFLHIKAVGKLTHADYQLMTPMIESALEAAGDPHIHALVDGTELDGWEARAAWDDFKLGLHHGKQFEKIAIYGNRRWQELAAKIGSWFIAGEVRYFEDLDDALRWLTLP